MDVDHTVIAKKWSLNEEQLLAFNIIVKQSFTDNAEPLRLMLSGPGGTGKSRIINAVTDYFRQRRQENRIKLTSFTGVAARNIRGMTLHSALCLSQ
ncbi:hypothetical protein C8J56DRAFT_773546, partial [Mycena floridula]